MGTCCGGIETVNGKCPVCGEKDDCIEKAMTKKIEKKRVLKYRVIIYNADQTILDMYEFEGKQRKDGLSKPLCDFLWTAFEIKPQGGSVMLDKWYE